MTSDTIVASRKRLVLALYVDLILFLVIWGLANFTFGGDAYLVAGVFVFAVVRLLAWKLKGSPGTYFLSIGPDRLVDPEIFRRENWLTMLLGAVFVLEGTKSLVNWTGGVVPAPIFGWIPDDTTTVAIDLMVGIFLVYVGFLYFKLRPLGFWLALVSILASLGSLALSWSLLRDAMPAIVAARRAAQGRITSESEVQFMQAYVPAFTAILLLCVLVAVLWSYRRFHPRDR